MTEEVQLWCLAAAGCSASAFAPLRSRLDRRVTVSALELPGRGSRLRERLLYDAEELFADLLGVVRPRLAHRFAFFGHSLGGILAAECCRRLEREGRGVAQHLFVAAARPPHRVEPGRSVAGPRTDEQLVTYLREVNGTPDELLSNVEFMEMFLQTIRADLSVLDTYRCEHTGSLPLNCPITALAGTRDFGIDARELSEWQRHTTAQFALQRIEGDHFSTVQSAAVRDLVQSTLIHG